MSPRETIDYMVRDCRDKAIQHTASWSAPVLVLAASECLERAEPGGETEAAVQAAALLLLAAEKMLVAR